MTHTQINDDGPKYDGRTKISTDTENQTCIGVPLRQPKCYRLPFLPCPDSCTFAQIGEARCRDAQELQPHPKYASMHSIKYLLWWLISGTKGGKTRGRLILALRQRPANANQLAEVMAVDYKTARHHLDVLQKNGLVTYAGEGYGATYFLSPQLDENFAIFEEIWSQIGKKQKRV